MFNNEWGKFGKLLITSTRRDAENSVREGMISTRHVGEC